MTLTLSMKGRDIDLAQLLEHTCASAPRPARRKAQLHLLLAVGGRRGAHLLQQDLSERGVPVLRCLQRHHLKNSEYREIGP